MNQELMEMINKLDLEELKKLVHLKEEQQRIKEEKEQEVKELNLQRGVQLIHKGCNAFIELDDFSNLKVVIEDKEYSIYVWEERDEEPYLAIQLSGYDKEIKLEA
jgi:hypothetical protein